jgi:hypothetical protein
MKRQRDIFRDRYIIDQRGRRVLTGLSAEEIVEFEMLDAILPFDKHGNIAWEFEGHPKIDREVRWLELYTTHCAAWNR